MKKLSFLFSLILISLMASCSMMISDFKGLSKEVSFYVEYIGESVTSSDYDYSNPIKEKKSVQLGSPNKYEPEPIEGFTFDSKIVGNGSSGYYVKAFYKRNEIKVSFDPNGAMWLTDKDISETKPRVISGKYGSSLTAPSSNDLIHSGYAFDGWSETKDGTVSTPQTEFVFPAENKTYYAKWSVSSANYTVSYQLEDKLNPGNYLEIQTETFAGTVDSTTEVKVDSLDKIDFVNEDKEGFTLKEIEQQVIKADGSTVVYVYIERNTVKLTFKITGGNWNKGGSSDIEISGKYGVAVSYDENIVNSEESSKEFWPVHNCSDEYSFNGWFLEGNTTSHVPLPAAFPVGNKTYLVDWAKDKAFYTVEYYKETINGSGEKVNFNHVDYYYEKIDSMTQKVYSSFMDSDGNDVYTGVVPEEISGFNCIFDKDSDQSVVKADNSTVVKVYYNRKDIVITFDANGGKWANFNVLEIIVGKYDSGVTNLPSSDPKLTYFTFEGWSETPDGDICIVVDKFPAADKTYYAVWDMTGAHYAVSYMLQNADDEGYTKAETVQDLGIYTIGEEKVLDKAILKTIEGFNLVDETGSDNWKKIVVADDVDSLGNHSAKTIFEAKYNRKIIVLPLALDGGSSSVDVVAGRYGAAVVVPENPTKAGYSFDGWNPALPTTYPLNPETQYTAIWVAGEVEYKVYHYQKGFADETPDEPFETENFAGVTGELTAAVVKNYTGFTAEPVNQEVIKGDGSTIVKLFYTRNDIHLVFDPNGGTIEPAFSDGKFGQPVSIDTSSYTRPGYSFAGWVPALPVTYPAEPAEKYVAQWSAGATTYNVEHKKYGLDGNLGEATDTETLDGNTGATTNATAKIYNGFTADEITQKTIKGDGSTVVTVTYSRNTYKITLDANGGTNIPDSISGLFEQAVTLDPSEFTKTGYTFGGWTPALPSTYTENISCTAVWNAATVGYKVNHHKQNVNLDGYDVPITDSSKTGVTGEETEAAANVYEGFTAGSFEQKIIAGDGSTVVDIYYTRNSITLNLNLNGGSGASSSISGKYGTSVTKPLDSSLTKTGYTFNGWSPVLPDQFPASPAASYVAQWTANTYKVTFKANGGIGADVEQNFTYSVPKALTANGFSKTGYTFGGWATSSDGAKVYENSQEYTIGAENVTLYAVWIENGAHSISYRNIEAGDTNSNVVSFKETDTISLAAAVRPGYTFGGWYFDSGLSGSNVTGWAPGAHTSDVTVYAKWTANSDTPYTVKHWKKAIEDADPAVLSDTDTSSGTTDTVTAALAKEYTGFTADSFDQSTIKGDGSTVINIYYSRKEYTLTLNANGGSNVPASVSGKYGKAVSVNTAGFTRAGYTFGGWSPVLPSVFEANGSYTVQWTANTTTPYTVKHYKQNIENNEYTLVSADTENKTGTTDTTTSVTAKAYTGFTAKPITQQTITGDGNAVVQVYYDRNIVTLSFNSDGGTTVAPVQGKFEAPVTAPSAPTKVGYTFSKWNETVPSTFPAANKEFTAEWIAATVGYKVEHYQADLTGSYGAVFATDNLTGKTGDTTAAVAKSYEGFTAGEITQKTIVAEGSTVVKVYYTRNNVSLTLNLAGGSGISTTLTGKFGAAVPAAGTPTKAGYTFASWSPALPSTFPASPAASYVAQWTANTNTPYTVKHMQQSVNGGDNYSQIGEAVNMTGTTGALTAAVANTYDGFEAGVVAQKTIDGNGTTVVEVKYNRKDITLTLNLAGGTGLTSVHGLYGSSVSVTNPTKANFTFDGWSPAIPSTFPASPATYTATWKAGIQGSVVINSLSGDVSVTAAGGNLTATPPYSGSWSYQWIVDNAVQSSTTNSITVSSTGEHTVMVIATANGLSFSSTLKVVIQ